MPDLRQRARDYFRDLLERPQSSESDWQQLFAEHPCIFIESLPLKIHPGDIEPLARPGHAESDFVLFPHRRDPLTPSGLIEIKRRDTRILRVPRRDVLRLSSDAATALAQAQKYALTYNSQAITRPDELVVLGNNYHIFIIAGMSTEIAAKVTTDLLKAQFKSLLPTGVHLIPYDTLLTIFESKLPPRIHILQTALPHAKASLAHLLRAVETAYESFKGKAGSENTMEEWTALEDEYIRIQSSKSAEKRIINRTDFEYGSQPDLWGKRPLAMESPSHIEFGSLISDLIAEIIVTAESAGLRSYLPKNRQTLFEEWWNSLHTQN
jgi:hypothetical protein